MDLVPLLTALAVAVTPVVLGTLYMRRYNRLGGSSVQSDLITTLQAQATVLRAENADLRADLAGCESENRGFRRVLREQQP